ncbi:hypothetical protein [Mucilaginibacter sp. cycad4]|uniref:hypothetical protein n=1 Tax=Mucilaginibacter sp. cycad4 TaxID=3342096 RepID=UPI00359F399F
MTEQYIKQRPALVYEFYTINDAPAELKCYTLSTYALNKNHNLRYAVNIDDQK